MLGLHLTVLLALKLTDRLRIEPSLVAPKVLLFASPMPASRSAELEQPRFAIIDRMGPHVTLSPIPDIVVGVPPSGDGHVAKGDQSSGLKLSINPEARSTIEQMFPSPADRRKQFFKNQAREDEFLNRNLVPRDHACEAFGIPEDRLPIPSSNEIAKVFVPGFSITFGGKSPDDVDHPKKPCL